MAAGAAFGASVIEIRVSAVHAVNETTNSPLGTTQITREHKITQADDPHEIYAIGRAFAIVLRYCTENIALAHPCVSR